jgi:hypothetical protein
MTTCRMLKHFVLGIAAGGGPLIVSSLDPAVVAQAGQPTRQCMYGVEGNCQPNWATWGYHQAQWRPWPTEYSGATTPPSSYAPPPHRVPRGIDVEVPTPDEEVDRNPSLPPAMVPQALPVIENGGGSSDPFRDDQVSPMGYQQTGHSSVPPLRAPVTGEMVRPGVAQPGFGNPVRSRGVGGSIPTAPAVPSDLAQGRVANPLRGRGAVVPLPIPPRNVLTPPPAAPELEAIPAPAQGEIAPVTFVEASPAAAESVPIPVAVPSSPATGAAFRNPLRR